MIIRLRTSENKVPLLFTLILLFALVGNLNAQAPATSFTAHAGNSSTDDGWGVGSDANGNIYVCGGFNVSITFGTTTLSSSGGRDMFLVKYDSTGAVQWAKKGGGSYASERGRAIAVDAAGNSYVCGYFYTSATFGNITVTSNGGYDIFVAKYNSSGTIQWVKKAGGSLDGDEAFDIALDANGNCFVAGYFSGTANFAPGNSLTSSGLSDCYILKYNTSGAFQWVKKIGGSGSDYAYGCIVDPSGNVGITGCFNGTANFGTSTSLTSSGSADVFIAKYNGSTGAVIYAKKAGGSSWDEARGMNADNQGNFYITGNYKGTATFGQGAGSSNITSTIEMYGSSPSMDIFTAAYDNSGNFKWVKSAGGGRDEGGRDVACDNYGNVNITGYFEGNIYFGTYYLQNVASHPAFAYEDPFAAQYDTAGTFNWAVHGGSGWHDAGYGIATDPWGNVLVTGTINPDGSTIGWNGTPFVGATNSNNGYDMFVVKMGNNSGPPPMSVTLTKTDVSCNGGSDGSINLTPSGGAQSYTFLWSTSDTTEDISGLTAGTYTVIVTDTFNNTIIDSITVNEPDSIIISFSNIDVNCFNGNDGSVNLTVTGGTPPFTYYWSNSATTQNIAGIPAGKYVVIVTDSQSCTASDSTILLQPASAISGQIFSVEETSTLSDGMAWVVVTGGTPGYIYLWDDPLQQTNDTAFNLIAGFYQAVFTDANGCSDSLSVEVADSTNVGINEVLYDSYISIYPNPSNGEINIEFKKATEVEISNSIGQIIFSENIEGKETIRVNLNSKPGIYLVKVKNDEFSVTKKLILN